jgi:hypothetical protein
LSVIVVRGVGATTGRENGRVRENPMSGVNALLRIRGVRWGLVIVVAILLTFEVTTRHLPPDGVTVTTIEHYAVFTSIPSGVKISYAVRATSHTTLATTGQTRAEIDTLNNVFAAAPFDGPTYTSYMCTSLGGWIDYQVTFTWHDLPVQVWTTDNGCPSFAENSGGIPNVLWTHTLSYSDQQILFALR